MADNVFQLHPFKLFAEDVGNSQPYLAGTASTLEQAERIMGRLCVEGIGDWDIAVIEDGNGNRVGGAYHGRPISEAEKGCQRKADGKTDAEIESHFLKFGRRPITSSDGTD